MAHSYNLQIVSYNLKLAICCIQHYGVITKNRLNDDNDDERKIINEERERGLQGQVSLFQVRCVEHTVG